MQDRRSEIISHALIHPFQHTRATFEIRPSIVAIPSCCLHGGVGGHDVGCVAQVEIAMLGPKTSRPLRQCSKSTESQYRKKCKLAENGCFVSGGRY